VRLLAIDLGDRRIGLAIGETVAGTGRGIETVMRRSPAADGHRLRGIIAANDIAAIVVGLPRHSDGREGAQAIATRAWVAAVVEPLGLPWTFRDEAWTSQAAEANLGRPSRGRSGGPPSAAARERRRRAVDREAARLILQAELDERRRVRP
jgi:putative Holliday junction resolvase